MKIQKKYVLSFIIIFVVIVVAGAIFASKSTITFKDAALGQVNLEEIDTIEIIKSDDNSTNERKITVSDPKEIHQIINEFSRVQLKKSNSSTPSPDSYWITIRSKQERKLGLTILGEKNIVIYKYNSANPKNSIVSYEIISGYNGKLIQNLFK
ncbi:hypothetical protein B4V02_23840 [Paenibacillus kribbensis]|uniref:DUF5301 domain-containing protein n=1 Tax=Paenibacillus kribbensis TaxID=172713 RepID=A0A222WS54_9BACL|nr:DUF5301 domain-containing protein [Paenibacillus kribbensis]ASR49500.1 hypothetical protein B4V02_23840 [Paenibacillus kribbensis]